jgi:hypothetical protein
MKKSPSTTVLLVILVITSLLSVLCCGLYIRSTMRLRDLQRTYAAQQQYRNFFLALMRDSIEYSKRNPAIDPLLEAANLKPKANVAATTNKPAGK